MIKPSTPHTVHQFTMSLHWVKLLIIKEHSIITAGDGGSFSKLKKLLRREQRISLKVKKRRDGEEGNSAEWGPQ